MVDWSLPKVRNAPLLFDNNYWATEHLLIPFLTIWTLIRIPNTDPVPKHEECNAFLMNMYSFKPYFVSDTDLTLRFCYLYLRTT